MVRTRVMFSSLKTYSTYRMFVLTIILAVALGIFTSVFFIIVDRDSYSSIYLVPDSVIHTAGNSTLFFEYGVISSETGRTEYTLETYLDDVPVNNKHFSLNPGEILEERQRVALPANITYPSKISLRLRTPRASEEVHFWLR